MTFIVSLLSAVEFVSFANIPIPFSPDKVIVLLFVILEAFCPNIPIDSLLFTLILPVFIPVALSAKIPIFFSLVVAAVKLIVPIFSADTFPFPTAVDSFTTIIPAEFLVLILISFLLVNDNLAVEAVTVDFTFPNIPADVLSLTVIVPAVSFVAETVPPVASSISANIPADVSFSVVIVPLFVAIELFPFLTYIPADVFSFVVIELSFSMLALSPNIPADVFFSVVIVPLFVAAEFKLEYIPTDSSSFVVIFPAVSFNKVELFFPNTPVAFLPFKVTIFLLVTVELSPAIPTIYSLLVPVIFPSFVNCEFASPYIPVE